MLQDPSPSPSPSPDPPPHTPSREEGVPEASHPQPTPARAQPTVVDADPPASAIERAAALAPDDPTSILALAVERAQALAQTPSERMARLMAKGYVDEGGLITEAGCQAFARSLVPAALVVNQRGLASKFDSERRKNAEAIHNIAYPRQTGPSVVIYQTGVQLFQAMAQGLQALPSPPTQAQAPAIPPKAPDSQSGETGAGGQPRDGGL